MTTNSQELNHVHVNQSFYEASTWATNFNGYIDLLPFSRRLKNGAFFLNLAISRLHQSFFWTTFLVTPQVHSLARQRCWFIQFVLINGLKSLCLCTRFFVQWYLITKTYRPVRSCQTYFFPDPVLTLLQIKISIWTQFSWQCSWWEQILGIQCRWAAPDLVTPVLRVAPS